MPRVHHPALSESASGTIRGAGYFQRRGVGYVFARFPRAFDRRSTAQLEERACFAAALAAWQARPLYEYLIDGKVVRKRAPAWPTWWRLWRAADCEPPAGTGLLDGTWQLDGSHDLDGAPA